MPLPRCFFDIAINGVPTGRIVFELFADVCPKTCENFRCLCTGEKGEGKTTFKPLHFKGTPIHRIVKGFIVQGGDFVNGDGTGGESIFGGLFGDESFKLKHDQGFLLSMANKGPDTNGSQFFITTAPAPHLDGIHVIFGRVVDGQQFVTEMENQKVDASHRPYADVRITNCGELVLLRRGKKVKSKRAKVALSSESDLEESSSDAESSSSEEERRKRKKRHRKKHSKRKAEKRSRREKKRKKHSSSKKHRKHRHKNSDSGESGEASEGEVEGGGEEVVPAVSTISTEDLPDEGERASRPSWLYRPSRSPSPHAEQEKETVRRTYDKPSFVHRNEVSVSGRKIKGRGIMRYRTPPKESNYRLTESYGDHRDNNRSRREGDWAGRDGRRRSRSRERHGTWREQRSRSPRERQRRERSRSRERRPRERRNRSNERRRERSRSSDQHREHGRHNNRHRSHSSERRQSERRHNWEGRDRSSREQNLRTHDGSPRSKESSSKAAVNNDTSNHNDDDRAIHRRSSMQEENRLIVDKEEEILPTFTTSYDDKRQSKGSWSYNHEDNWHGSPHRPSRWDRRGHRSSDESSSSSGSADEGDRELEQAYQNVERTLAEQQFGISSLFD